MGFRRDGTQRHRTSSKPLHDFGGGLDVINWYGLGWIELKFKQAAQRHMATRLVVDDLGVLFVTIPVFGTRAVLQFCNGIRRPHMLFTARAPSVLSTGVQHVGQHGGAAKGELVHAQGLFGDLENTDTLNPAWCAGEVLVNEVGVQTNRFEQLRAAVAHVGRHAHLGHDFRQTFAYGLHVVCDGFFRRQITGQLRMQAVERLHGQVGVNRLGTVASQHRKMMYFAG